MGLPCSGLNPPDVPAVYECVDSTFERLGSNHYRRASRRRCIIHCQTDRIRSALDARYAPHGPRWQTVTNPIYFADYGPEPPAGDRDPGLVAFVGRLHPIKNPLLLIEAAALARRRGCPCRVMMLGEGPLQRQIKALVARHGLEDVVSIAFQPQVVRSLGKAAIYVSLQTGDNYGSQALLEAMGAGCAIIASDIGLTRQIVTDEVGVRVPLTAEAVCGAIEALVGDPGRTRQLGMAAACIARTRYSADAYASFLESLYERAVQYHRGGDGSVTATSEFVSIACG
jgi:glycosyltransferase involved in cell wall biosynthesis